MKYFPALLLSLWVLTCTTSCSVEGDRMYVRNLQDEDVQLKFKLTEEAEGDFEKEDAGTISLPSWQEVVLLEDIPAVAGRTEADTLPILKIANKTYSVTLPARSTTYIHSRHRYDYPLDYVIINHTDTIYFSTDHSGDLEMLRSAGLLHQKGAFWSDQCYILDIDQQRVQVGR